jgi:putative membrane protein insertion efficiency factor
MISRENKMVRSLATLQKKIESEAIMGVCLFLRAYKLCVSPLLGQNCRFYPSCSDYTTEALKIHGILRGGVLSLKRLCKCHPCHAGGIDLVPSCKSITFTSLFK